MNSTLQIRTEAIGQGAATIRLAGILNSDTRGPFDSEIRRMLAESRLDLSIDLAGIEHVGSTGAGALIEALLTAQEAGGRMCFCNLTPRVRHVFRTMGLPTDSEGLGKA